MKLPEVNMQGVKYNSPDIIAPTGFNNLGNAYSAQSRMSTDDGSGNDMLQFVDAAIKATSMGVDFIDKQNHKLQQVKAMERETIAQQTVSAMDNGAELQDERFKSIITRSDMRGRLEDAGWKLDKDGQYKMYDTFGNAVQTATTWSDLGEIGIEAYGEWTDASKWVDDEGYFLADHLKRQDTLMTKALRAKMIDQRETMNLVEGVGKMAEASVKSGKSKEFIQMITKDDSKMIYLTGRKVGINGKSYSGGELILQSMMPAIQDVINKEGKAALMSGVDDSTANPFFKQYSEFAKSIDEKTKSIPGEFDAGEVTSATAKGMQFDVGGVQLNSDGFIRVYSAYKELKAAQELDKKSSKWADPNNTKEPLEKFQRVSQEVFLESASFKGNPSAFYDPTTGKVSDQGTGAQTASADAMRQLESFMATVNSPEKLEKVYADAVATIQATVDEEREVHREKTYSAMSDIAKTNEDAAKYKEKYEQTTITRETDSETAGKILAERIGVTSVLVKEAFGQVVKATRSKMNADTILSSPNLLNSISTSGTDKDALITFKGTEAPEGGYFFKEGGQTTLLPEQLKALADTKEAYQKDAQYLSQVAGRMQDAMQGHIELYYDERLSDAWTKALAAGDIDGMIGIYKGVFGDVAGSTDEIKMMANHVRSMAPGGLFIMDKFNEIVTHRPKDDSGLSDSAPSFNAVLGTTKQLLIGGNTTYVTLPNTEAVKRMTEFAGSTLLTGPQFDRYTDALIASGAYAPSYSHVANKTLAMNLVAGGETGQKAMRDLVGWAIQDTDLNANNQEKLVKLMTFIKKEAEKGRKDPAYLKSTVDRLSAALTITSANKSRSLGQAMDAWVTSANDTGMKEAIITSGVNGMVKQYLSPGTPIDFKLMSLMKPEGLEQYLKMAENSGLKTITIQSDSKANAFVYDGNVFSIRNNAFQLEGKMVKDKFVAIDRKGALILGEHMGEYYPSDTRAKLTATGIAAVRGSYAEFNPLNWLAKK